MISFDSFERIASAPLNTWPGTLVVAALSVLFAIGVHLVGARILVRIARSYPLMSVVSMAVGSRANPATCSLTRCNEAASASCGEDLDAVRLGRSPKGGLRTRTASRQPGPGAPEKGGGAEE